MDKEQEQNQERVPEQDAADILVVPTRYAMPFWPNGGIMLPFMSQVEEWIENCGCFRPREMVEEDPNWLQIIPYMIFVDAAHTPNTEWLDAEYLQRLRIFSYQRPNKEATAEKRLANMRSIGFGGHIHRSDDLEGYGSPLAAYYCGARRELGEELNFPVTHLTCLEPNAVIVPNLGSSNTVDHVHVGIVHFMWIDGEPEALAQGVNRDEIRDPKWLEVKQLEGLPLESWSIYALGSLPGLLELQMSREG